MFEKEIERISQEFNKIVGDFKVSTQKAIIKLKNEEMMLLMRFGFEIPLESLRDSRSSIVGWYFGDCSDYTRIFN